MALSRKQRAGLKLGAGYYLTHIATPEQRKAFARVGWKTAFAKYRPAEMSRRGKLAPVNSPEQIEKIRQLGNRNSASGFLDQKGA
jgi:hypothetical protein